MRAIKSSALNSKVSGNVTVLIQKWAPIIGAHFLWLLYYLVFAITTP
jgi:hypothetical protein